MHNDTDTTNYVCECNRAYHAETLHPMVSLIDTAAPCDAAHLKTDCYAVVMRHRAEDSEKYGRRYYDFSEATLLFVTPQRAVDLATADGKMLIFHPDLVKFTPLGLKLKDFTFFKYRQDEALHISHCEEKVINRCFDSVSSELCWGVDEYSRTIICNIIELLLNYCRRFYNRQFITRHDVNVDLIDTLQAFTDRYLASGRVATKGMPTAGLLARKLDMSAEYLNDMLKSETGKTFSEYAQLRRLLMAKQMLVGTDKPVGEISDLLGFCTEKCFAVVFKKTVGCTPEEYRHN